MDLKMGSHTFTDVQIPLLWGSRAVIQDQQGRLSVIDLSGGTAKPEIINDKPAPGISSKSHGSRILSKRRSFDILSKGKPIYSYDPGQKMLSSIEMGLPECQIGPGQIRVGSSTFSNNMFVGVGIGIVVTKSGFSMGAPLPAGLARLVI